MSCKGLVAVLIMLSFCVVVPCAAQETAAPGDVETRLKAVEETIARQQEVIDQQARRIQELAPATQAGQETQKLEAKAAGTTPAPELPAWLNGLKFSGDLRLRYAGKFYEDSADENMGRFRLRFGFEKQMTEEVLAGFRLASGSSADPTSTDQTLTGSFGKKTVWIDLAYAIYKPKAFKGLTLAAGKVKNPFVTTDMMWDTDVNPEGAFQNYTWQATDRLKPFVTMAELMADSNTSAPDANLLALQAGWDMAVCPAMAWTLATTYYDHMNVEEAGNFYDANGNTESGGVLTAGDFDVVDLVNVLSFKKCRWPVKAFGHISENLGDRAPRPDNDLSSAWAAGLVVGTTEQKGNWQLDYEYKHIDANAFPGAFVDHNFGANREGHVVGLSYVLYKNITARIETFITEPEKGHDEDLMTVNADLVFKL